MLTPSPEQEADAILRAHWADDAGQLSVPIDPIVIARRLGIDVYSSELDPDVSAVIVADADGKTTIYVSVRDAWVRQRFSCGHEIGHYVRRRASGTHEFGFVDRRDHLSSTGTDQEERFANRFSAALLMPEALLRISPQRDPAALAPLFAVSATAMALRLRTLGLSS